jgi:hypothetical protein
MAIGLIELEDGTLVAVDLPSDQVQQISGGLAHKVNETFHQIKPTLVNACRPIAAAWKELSQEMYLEEAEVELGLSFEGEGNIYITRGKAGANLTVKLVLKPQDDTHPEER